jgi:hypothetical protein
MLFGISKTELFKKIINEISDRFLNEINNSLDDLFLFFILVRRAKALKYIKKYYMSQFKKSRQINPKLNILMMKKKLID